MNRRIGIALIAAIVLLAYPVAAWLIGLKAEHQWQEREQQIIRRYPFLETVKHEYHRGVYSSTEVVTYRIGGSLANAMRMASGGMQTPDLQITVRNTLHHGPLPQLRAFSPATIDTEIALPPQIKQKLAEIFGDQAALGIRTRLHWLGGSTTTVHSPAFEQKTPDAVTINWRGLDGTTDVGSDLEYYRGNFTSPGLDVKAGRGNLTLENLRATVDQASSAFEGVYLGTLGVTLGRLEIVQPSSSSHAVSLQNLAVTSKSSAQGEYIDIDVGVNTGAVQFQQFNITHAGYEIRGSHLHGPSLAAMTRSFQSLGANTTAGPGPDKVMEILEAQGAELLLHDPVLELPRIGFAMSEGELLISVRASAHGLTRADLDGPPGTLKAAFIKNVQASADVRIDTALLDKLLDTSGNADKFTAPLQGLQRQGYLKLDGKALTTHLTFDGGRLQVNGLSFPPLPGGPHPPPSGHP